MASKTTVKSGSDDDFENNVNNELTTPLLPQTSNDETTTVDLEKQPSQTTATIDTKSTSGGAPGQQTLLYSNSDDDDLSSSPTPTSSSSSRLTGTRRLLKLAGPHKCTLIVGCIVLLIRLPFSLIIPHFVSEVLGAVGEQRYDDATRNIMLLVICGSIDSVLDFGCVYFFGAAQNRILRALRVDTFAAILRQEVAFFDATSTGELVSRLTSDCGAMSGDLTWFFRFSIEASVRIIFIAVYMLIRSPTLGGAALCIVPVIAFFNKLYGDWLAQNAKKVQDSLAQATSVAQESLSCARTVIAFAAEDEEVNKYDGAIDENYRLNMRQLVATGIYFMVMSTFLVNTVIQATLLYIGMIMIKNGNLNATTLLAFMLYQGQLQSYTLQLFQSYSSLVKSAGAGDQIFALLDRKPKKPGTGHPDVARRMVSSSFSPSTTTATTDTENGDNIPNKDEASKTVPTPRDNGLMFSNVNFVYPTRLTQSVLEGVSLEVPPGSSLALVGPSGCGKSTMVNLIERFYDPFPGRILVGGVDLTELNICEHRRSIGIVTQDPILFSGTILSNIIYGTPSANFSEAVQAAKLANAHNFIVSFPDGYDTAVGERGVQLSGGQKQRICIARAVVKNPRILLLDEATSALDSESEALVQQALDRLLSSREGGMTTVVIAHRLQTVRNADCICVMEPRKGVVEKGRHEELMMIEGGRYRSLVEAATPAGLLPE